MNKLEQFVMLLFLEKKSRLLNEGYERIIADSGRVMVKTGTKFHVIIVDNSIEYRVDKKTLDVYDFYRKYRGSIDDNIKRLQNKIMNYPKRGNFEPSIVIDKSRVVASKGYVDRIFYNSWGYDQTNNDFVQVVSETDKQVKVRKIVTKQNYDNQSMTGSEIPLRDVFISKEFILVKEMYRGEPALKGIDKSGSGSSQSAIWSEWKGEPISFSSYA